MTGLLTVAFCCEELIIRARQVQRQLRTPGGPAATCTGSRNTAAEAGRFDQISSAAVQARQQQRCGALDESMGMRAAGCWARRLSLLLIRSVLAVFQALEEPNQREAIRICASVTAHLNCAAPSCVRGLRAGLIIALSHSPHLLAISSGPPFGAQRRCWPRRKPAGGPAISPGVAPTG